MPLHCFVLVLGDEGGKKKHKKGRKMFTECVRLVDPAPWLFGAYVKNCLVSAATWHSSD